MTAPDDRRMGEISFDGSGVVNALHQALGFRPLDAIAVALLDGSGDVPISVTQVPYAMDLEATRRIAAELARDFRDEPSTTRALIVMYLSSPLGSPKRPAGFPLVSRLVKKLDQAGPDVLAAYFVAADCWGEYRLEGGAAGVAIRRSLDQLRPAEIRSFNDRPEAPSPARSATADA